MRVQIKRGNDLIAALKAFPQKADSTGKRIVKRAGNKIVEMAGREVPYDKGVMAKAIIARSVKSGFGVRVSPEIFYALFVHEGTGEYYQDPTDYGKARANRVRRYWLPKFANRDAMYGFFAGRRKHGRKFSIKPNRFMLRGAKRAEEPIDNIIVQEISKLINQ